VKTEMLPKDSLPELNTKNLSNTPSFLTITHTTLSAKRIRSYRILTIDVAAEFYFWTEQQQNGSSNSSLRLAKTPEVLKTIFGRQLFQLSDGLLNISKWLAICELWQSETQPVAETTNLVRLHLPV
jgi:hypothetical protein